jgi:hypothetical protein
MKDSTGKIVRRAVGDLGIAAYIKMNGYKCIGRGGKNFYFDIYESEQIEFDKLIFEYSNSPMHKFDSELMSLKRLPQYLPD